MADNLHYRGFKWSFAANGGRPAPAVMWVPLASGYTFTINGGAVPLDLSPGMPVTRLSTGYWSHAAGNEAAGNNGAPVDGIVAEIGPYYDGTAMIRNNKFPSGQGVYGTNFERQTMIGIVDAAAGYWEVDCDDKTTATTYAAYLAFLGENADHRFVDQANGDCMLDISTHGTATAQWRIEYISKAASNVSFADSYVKLVVRVNESHNPPFTATGV